MHFEPSCDSLHISFSRRRGRRRVLHVVIATITFQQYHTAMDYLSRLSSLMSSSKGCGYSSYHVLLWLCALHLLLCLHQSESTCEIRYIDAPPPPNFSRMEELVQSTSRQMAHQLGQYLADLPEDSLSSRHGEIKAKAIEIARQALQEKSSVLAAGIAAAFVPFAVVQFQNSPSTVEAQTKREFLAAYWRVMGSAWNRTSNTEKWELPFRDCGPLKGRWVWPFTATMQVTRYKLVTAVFLPADTDPCIASDALAVEIFGRRHACNRETEICIPSTTSDRNAYACDCRPGYIRQQPQQSLSLDPMSSSSSNSLNSTSPTALVGECIPCQLVPSRSLSGACNASLLENYNGNLDSFLSEVEEVASLSLESLMNATFGAIIGSCILTAMALGLLVYRKRKFKTIAMSMWTILETIIIGIVIMYSAVLLHYLEASTLRCLLEPWLRELGFVICYGAITLKLYRHLIEFRTRKAHRCVVRDVDLLKYLCAMVVAVLCYLSAFTASSLDFVEHSQQLDGLRVENNLCRPLKWDYVTEAGEMAVLLFGIYLSYISRNAKTMFQERNFLVAAIIIEFVVSINFYIFRAVYMDRLSAQVLFLCLFVRSQLTNTVTLGLVFLPKLLHPQKKGMNESAFRSGTSGGPNLSAADPDIGEVTLSEMNPEEIRKELKRLYTQLEILKNKTLRLDNPHISKRRGGRKTHRRFSLQKKGSKDKALHAKNRAHAHHDAEITEAEPSRTPEDSVCSVEGAQTQS